MKLWRFHISALLCLAACGSQQGLDQALFSEVIASAQRRTQPSLSETLRAEDLSGLPGPLLFLEVPSRQAEAVAGSAGLYNGHEVWATQDAITVSFQGGVLSTTRGLGNDLMSADLSEVLSALAGRRSQATRAMQYLTGEEQIETRVYLCDYTQTPRVRTQTRFASHLATQITETCMSSDSRIENDYWVDATGTHVKSRQWIGPVNGYLNVERIKD